MLALNSGSGCGAYQGLQILPCIACCESTCRWTVLADRHRADPVRHSTRVDFDFGKLNSGFGGHAERLTHLR